MHPLKVSLFLGALCALGTVGGTSAGPTIPPAAVTYLITDQNPPQAALTWPDQPEPWAGPAGWTVYYRLNPGGKLQVQLYVGLSRPNPDPVVRPGPDWWPATVWYQRTPGNTTALIVASERGNIWGNSGANFPTSWDGAKGILTVTLP